MAQPMPRCSPSPSFSLRVAHLTPPRTSVRASARGSLCRTPDSRTATNWRAGARAGRHVWQFLGRKYHPAWTGKAISQRPKAVRQRLRDIRRWPQMIRWFLEHMMHGLWPSLLQLAGGLCAMADGRWFMTDGRCLMVDGTRPPHKTIEPGALSHGATRHRPCAIGRGALMSGPTG